MTRTTQDVQVYRVYIRATPQAIWDAIVKPEWSQKYGYGTLSEFDLRPGGAFRGLASPEMMAMGSPELAVDGEVVESDPPRKLVQTWRLLMDPRLATQGFTQLTYEIDERKSGITRLTVTHEMRDTTDLAPMLAGELEGTGAGGGWNFVLSDLKSLLETGEGLGWTG